MWECVYYYILLSIVNTTMVLLLPILQGFYYYLYCKGSTITYTARVLLLYYYFYVKNTLISGTVTSALPNYTFLRLKKYHFVQECLTLFHNKCPLVGLACQANHKSSSIVLMSVVNLTLSTNLNFFWCILVHTFSMSSSTVFSISHITVYQRITTHVSVCMN